MRNSRKIMKRTNRTFMSHVFISMNHAKKMLLLAKKRIEKRNFLFKVYGVSTRRSVLRNKEKDSYSTVSDQCRF